MIKDMKWGEIALVKIISISLTPLPSKLFIIDFISFFVFDQYSAAAYFMASLCIVTLFLLLTKFQARYRTKPVAHIKSKRQLDQDEFANNVTWCGLTVQTCALIECMLLNIATVGCFGAFETMGVHFAESYYNLQPAVAGTVVSINGMIGVCTLWNLGYLGRFFLDTQIIMGGISVFAVGILSFAWLQSVEMGAENSIVHYILGVMMIYGIGYPIGVTALIGLFSKGKYMIVH
jgi:ceroid-lipofuscinosis MFS transporter 7